MTTLELAGDDDHALHSDRRAGWTRTLGVLLFFSAFPALIYQFIIFGLLGGGIEPVSIVIATFMLGLGLGSLGGGWLSKRPAVPLLPLLAAIELVSGACGLAALHILNLTGDVTDGLRPIAAVVAALALIVPALPLGAVLPLLVGDLTRRSGHVGNAVGLLHCVMTLGAGVACLACLLLLFRFVGVAGAVYVAAAIGAAVASGALAAHWGGRRAPVTEQAPAMFAPRKSMLGLVPLLGLAAAGGFVALSYEIFFFRSVSYATDSAATAFIATLGAFLVGLAAGSRRAGDNCAALTREGVMRRAVGTLMKANLLGLPFLPLIDHLAWLDRGVVVVAFLMVYLVARFWGALLPYLAELGIAPDRHAGMRTALLHLAYCLGAAAGAIVTGLVLMERLGVVATGAALVVAGLACALLLIGAVRMPRSEKILRASLAVTLGLLAVVAIPSWSGGVLERLQWISAAYTAPLVQAVENPSR
jgi:spermidine synthase